MYPRIPQPLTRTVIRTKSPIKTLTKPDTPLKNIETPQSKNKLHSSLSSHSPTPTKSHLSSSASKPKNPSEVLKNWYASNSSVTVYSKTPVRSNISPIKGMSTEPDMREYKSLTTRSPNKSPLRMQQNTAAPSDFFEGQENLNYLSQSSRKGDNFASTSRERENNRSVGLSDYESENLKKHLNSDMRISLGNYVLQKLTGRVLKKAAMKKLIENMEHKKAGLQDKILKLMALAAEAEAEKKDHFHFQSEKKDRKKAHDELFDEEILTETGTQNSSDRKHVEPAKTLLDKYKSQKMSKGQSHSALPTESVSTERSSRTAEDWAELFLKKVEMDTKKEKNNPVKQESVGNGRVQHRKLRDTAKAAIVIQRAFRRYVKRIKKDQMQTAMQNQSTKVEKVNIQGKQSYPSTVERELSSSGIVEQLTTELELAKKKNAYLQKENESLEDKVKKLEGDIERRVNERLTIERARIKDTLSEYSTFIDKLLSEKKQLEEKTANQAQLITELCARLENKTTAIEKQQSAEEYEENREYNSILKEKEALKTKLSARVLEPLIDFNTSKRVDENKQAFHKGSFGATDEKVNFHSVPNESNFVKPLPELHFSPQIPKTDSRKNSEQSQAESAKFMYNSYNQESSSLLTEKKNQDFMFMSADTPSARQIQDAKVKRNKSAERDVKSAREALEFSFEAKADAKDDEEDFSEPFVLSVALQDKSLRKTLSARSVSQEPKQSQESHSVAKSDTKQSVTNEKETKISRDRLQMARIEKRKAKEQTDEEGLVPELDNLIANLSKRLYIEEGNEGDKNINASGNPSISKSSSSDLQSEGVESMKTENIFQKLSRSHQKG